MHYPQVTLERSRVMLSWGLNQGRQVVLLERILQGLYIAGMTHNVAENRHWPCKSPHAKGHEWAYHCCQDIVLMVTDGPILGAEKYCLWS